MAELSRPSLRGKRILIVEDEYLIAADLTDFFEQEGAIVVGPVASVHKALTLIRAECDTRGHGDAACDLASRLDGAVLDINLRGERSYPIADALLAQGVQPVFTTGYEALVLPPAYAGLPRLSKPVERPELVRLLLAAMRNGGR